MQRRLRDLARHLLLQNRLVADKFGRYVSPCAQGRSLARASVGIFPGQNFRMEVSLSMLLTYRHSLSTMKRFRGRGTRSDEVYEGKYPNAHRSAHRLLREGAWWRTHAPLRDGRPFLHLQLSRMQSHQWRNPHRFKEQRVRRLRQMRRSSYAKRRSQPTITR